MQISEDRPASEREQADVRVRVKPRASRLTDRLAGTARTAPRGADSRIGDDETHRRLQEARNRATHSTEFLIKRELGPEWV
jgi:hypothetical protein